MRCLLVDGRRCFKAGAIEMHRSIYGILLSVCCVGCSNASYSESADEPNANPANGQAEKLAGEGQLAKPKTTDEIAQFDPAAGNEIVDSDVKISNPITGALEAYGPLKQQISGLAVTQSVKMFRATEGRYPKTHEEFKSKVIQANQIRLPVPGDGLQYQYDVENHRLVVVRLKK